MLKKKSKTESEKCKKIFKFFIQKFYTSLVEDHDLKETVIAIKGYGAFAGVSCQFTKICVAFNLILENDFSHVESLWSPKTSDSCSI